MGKMQFRVKVRSHPSVLIKITVVKFAPLLLAVCLQAKQHSSYNIYIDVHSVIWERDVSLRLLFFLVVVRQAATEQSTTVGFPEISLKSLNFRDVL